MTYYDQWPDDDLWSMIRRQLKRNLTELASYGFWILVIVALVALWFGWTAWRAAP